MGDLEKRPERLIRPGQVYRPEPIVPRDIWVDREVAADGRVIEVHHHYHAPEPAPERKLNAADKFTPYFVIMAYLVVIVGCLGIVGMMIVPPFMAAVMALTASLVSIMAAAVSVLIVLAVIAWIIRGMISDQRKQDQDESE
jgi:hypothetical protein